MIKINRLALHWKLQGLGLVLLTCLSFNPKLFHFGEYFFFFMLFVSIGVTIVQGNTLLLRTPIDLTVGLLVLWILLTIPFSIDPVYSFSEWRKVAGRILVFYWAMLVLKHQPEINRGRSIILAVGVGAIVLSMSGLVDFISKGGTLEHRGGRAIAFGGHSHWLATYMVMVVPFVTYLLVMSKNHWIRIYYGLTVLLVLAAQVASYSRGGWLAMASQGFLYGLLSGSRKTLLICLILISTVIIGIFGISEIGYLGGIFDITSIDDRLGCWYLGFQEILSSPIVGVGFGNNIFVRLYPGDPPGTCTGGHLHNTLLMFAMGSGVPGFVLLLWMFFVIVRHLLKYANNETRPEPYAQRIAVVLMVMGFLICMSFNYLFTGSLAYLFWILVAVGHSMPSENFSKPLGFGCKK